MRPNMMRIVSLAVVLTFAAISRAEIKTIVGYRPNQDAAADFKFTNIPAPSQSDAAGKAAVAKATPLSKNAHKVQLARVAVKRAILAAAEGGA